MQDIRESAPEFKVWCPVCDETAYLDEKEAAVRLAENHDANHHDGTRETFVSIRFPQEDR